MDFKKAVQIKKTFSIFEDAQIELINPNTHYDFITERQVIMNNEKSSIAEKEKEIEKLVCKYLICDWEGLFYGKKEIKFNQKNASSLMNTVQFKNVVYKLLFGENEKNFNSDLDLDLDKIAKN